MLDLTRLLPGALATMYLADYGATVIKIEQPGGGDYARHMFTEQGENPLFAETNRGKRSIAIDLKQAQMLALARTADVLIEGFRPGVMDRLGLGYEVLRAVNPRLVYVALTGYGQAGAFRDAAGHDLNYLAMSGVLDLIRERGGAPVVPGVQIADVAGGAMQSVMGVLLALAARERTGEGRFVDISMTREAAKLLVPHASGEPVLSGGYACYGVYSCRDGRWIAVGALETKFWEALCRGLGREDLAGHHLTPARQAELKRELSAIFEQQDADEWVRQLQPHDCCVTLVRTVSEAAACGRLTAGEHREGRAPALGEHTRDVLLECGLAEAEIDEYARLGAIA